MKELLVLSGKGGTGKTTLATAFIKLGDIHAYADCDVDAPNLHLLLALEEEPKTKDFYGMEKALVNPQKCIGCQRCIDHCRFDAIKLRDGKAFVDIYSCEGCGLCERLCPTGAIGMVEDLAGELKLYSDVDTFSTAQLRMGSGNSGKLVADVKKQLRENIQNEKIIVVDGSPGIGCPVIASMSGADLILIVTEPSVSGISDLKRLVGTASHFRLPVAVAVNKYDINLEKYEEIKNYSKDQGLPFVGEIAFDPTVVNLLNDGKSIVDEPGNLKTQVERVFYNTMLVLFQGGL